MTPSDDSHWGISEQIGASVRAGREARNLRQDDLVNAANDLGLQWSRSSVAELEAGRRRLTAEELLLLPHLLHVASGGVWATDVAELLSVTGARRAKLTTAQRLQLGETNTSDASVRALLAGLTAQAHNPAKDAVSVKHLSGLPLQLVAADPKAGEAERKAGRKLGLSPSEVVHRSIDLWGCTLSAERDRRVAAAGEDKGGASTRALRGHVTRQLLAELKEG